MKIEHIALWVKDIDKMKDFYVKYFKAESNKKYSNKRGFQSYFLTFDSGSRLELMTIPEMKPQVIPPEVHLQGYIHIAISVGSKEKVDNLTEQLRNDGYTVTGEARNTGDGYYESVILDPNGNKIEITI